MMSMARWPRLLPNKQRCLQCLLIVLDPLVRLLKRTLRVIRTTTLLLHLATDRVRPTKTRLDIVPHLG